jgi:hypothetical protein
LTLASPRPLGCALATSEIITAATIVSRVEAVS